MKPLVRYALVPVWLLASAFLAGGPSYTTQGPSEAVRADSARLLQKVAIIAQRGERASGGPLQTVVTERELNAYLASDAEIPVGISQPKLVIHGDRKVSATAVVDLDAVRARHKSTGMLDPVTYLAGKLPVSAAGFLDARDGKAIFQLESATVSGVPIPKMVLEEVIAYYTRSPQFPDGIDIDDPFPLPSRIRSIEVRRAEALVVQ